ncbi:hypothetical protein [Gordonia soli]|uniref:Tox-REase-5 domain-containing protein n=1 Tax=Gordonia soli NBRC 108243 TaxID=1223545 RepID=M0QHU9_9ACTN|nr:hypothetical protein [Gordonia soli]GAC68215.1 hypothetical protein GS4_14_00450 [Gordonia soli NBRC 108243]
MNRKSNTIPAVILGGGVLAVVVALALSFIPFSSQGSAGPTQAFRAQQDLDQVAFKLAGNAGARYTGKITYGIGGDTDTNTVEFKNLLVTSSKNTEGTVISNGNQAQYREIGNFYFANGPSAFWSSLLAFRKNGEVLDLAPVDNKWASLDYTAFPDLGYLLSPRQLAGRIANAERVSRPSLGLELPTPNKGLPDARYWPTSDPTITAIGNDKVKVNDVTTTFDPNTKTVTHVSGEIKVDRTSYTIDTSVEPLGADDISKVFASERSIAPELTNVPAPGVAPLPSPINVNRGGECNPVRCGFDVNVSGALNPVIKAPLRGRINYGINLKFEVNGRPAGEVGGSCDRIVSVPIGGATRTRCDATNLPASGGVVKSKTTYKFLPFLDYNLADLNQYIDENEKSAKQKVTMVRTGAKQPGTAADYNDQITGLPSSYAIEQNGYLFDGLSPTGKLHVLLSPGYAEHVTNGVFDPTWEGTATLTEQLKKQVQAAGDIDVIWWVSEAAAVPAVRALIASANIDPADVIVYNTPLDQD